MRDVRFTVDEHEGRLRLQFAAFGARPVVSWLSRIDEERLLTSTGEVLVFESCGDIDLLHQGPYTARRIHPGPRRRGRPPSHP
jgi:hypothetical protein